MKNLEIPTYLEQNSERRWCRARLWWQARPGFLQGIGWRLSCAAGDLQGGFAMRLAFPEQPRLDCPSVDAVPLNLNCRDEIIPILRALQHVYEQGPVRRELLELIGADVNPDSSPDRGR